MSAQRFLSTKAQGEFDDLIAEYRARGGEVTVGAPVHAKGNEASRGTRWTVNETRKEFRRRQREARAS